MKKNVLALSIAAMIGGMTGSAAFAGTIQGTGGTGNMTTATATSLVPSDDGKGHILVVPYYTAQDGNITAFNVVNTDSQNGKALKVRFRGAANSDDVLDFTVFLSPSDVWTGYVSKDSATGLAQFQTSDTSCTLPVDVKSKATKFDTLRLTNPAWTGDALANHTREGYVEILNMADIPKSTSDLYKTTKHKALGAAPTCDQTVLEATAALQDLANFVDSTTEEQDAVALGLNTPTGGLFGDWFIQNVPQATTFSGSSVALKAVDAEGNSARGRYVLFPQAKNTLIGYGETNANEVTADPLLRGNNPLVTPLRFDVPDLSTPYLNVSAYGAMDDQSPNKQATALSKALAVNSFTNQYATDAGVSGQTDWVLSMPTRRYSVAANYAATGSAYAEFNGNVNVTDEAPNGRFFGPANIKVDAKSGLICVSTAEFSFFDREEYMPNGVSVSPGDRSMLCGEVSVVAFGAAGKSTVLGASVARSDISGVGQNGWGEVQTLKFGTGLNGTLPIVGSSFIKQVNPAVTPGTAGNFGITWAHRYNLAY